MFSSRLLVTATLALAVANKSSGTVGVSKTVNGQTYSTTRGDQKPPPKPPQQ